MDSNADLGNCRSMDLDMILGIIFAWNAIMLPSSSLSHSNNHDPDGGLIPRQQLGIRWCPKSLTFAQLSVVIEATGISMDLGYGKDMDPNMALGNS